ncbi:MAG: SDR family NAD(P)-dependent oxidoreductase, partial [Acidimicrobiia bacterium]
AVQTGYPVEMLELDLDLEADLGIDTVKQAETFAAIRDEYQIDRDDELALRDFPTLAHVVQFVLDHRPDLVPAAPELSAVSFQPSARTEPAAPELTADSGQVTVDSEESVVEVSEPGAGGRGPNAVEDSVVRRVPVAVLRPAFDQCAGTGVELGEGSRVIVMHDTGGVGAALVKRLRKLGVETLELDRAPAADELETRLREWLNEGPITGVYWLPALDAAGDIDGMSFDEWREALRIRVKLLFTTMRSVYDAVGEPGTFLVSATRLGGRHGYDAGGAAAPLGGAVTGFSKTYKRERPDATVKAVDFPATQKRKSIARALIAETLHDPGVVEVGHEGGHRWTITLSEQPADDGEAGMDLNGDSVFLVTGAAGSITAAITTDLAEASGGVFHLLDVTPEPNPADEDLILFAEDREALKRRIFERIGAAGERATPALVEKELAGLERLDAALRAIRAVEAAGGRAFYHCVDLLDNEAVAVAIEAVKAESGRIDVLLHAGGLEISRLLPDKPAEQFDLVFDVKANGWFSLMSAIGDMPLGATVAFSSIAGRFGNGGQADYSAANDLLCKLASNFRRTRPATRGIAIDWTAWGDIGMATRGSIPTTMRAAGIDMLPATAGIPFIRRELTRGSRSGEVLVGGSLGLLEDDIAARGGLAPAGLPPHGGVMAGEVAGWSPRFGLVVETTLDPCEQGFLEDHRIDGTAVLPGVMGIEAFAEAACLPFPAHVVVSVEDVEFLAPFKFYRDEPRVITVQAQFAAEGDEVVAECRLVGSRTLTGHDQPQVTVHFTGRVRLARDPGKPATAKAVDLEIGGVGAPDIYSVYFHGPAYQVLERAWRADSTAVGLMATGLPDNHHPPEAPLRMDPRAIELCFQTAGVWELGTEGKMGLPMRLDKVWTADAGSADGRLVAVAAPQPDGSYRVKVVDESGSVRVDLVGYRTVQLPGGAGQALDPIRAAMGDEG